MCLGCITNNGTLEETKSRLRQGRTCTKQKTTELLYATYIEWKTKKSIVERSDVCGRNGILLKLGLKWYTKYDVAN